jgi:SAM-dependent methyltransferase
MTLQQERAPAAGAPARVRRGLARRQRRAARLFKRLIGRVTRPRRHEPFRRNFGSGAGQCVDRYYIEKFLHAHATDIQGHVLEIGDDVYTRRFGGGRVTRSEVLHVCPEDKRATIVADLTRGEQLAPNAFDCIILTQTLQFIYDHRAAIGTAYRILKPGGVLLATVPGITQISRKDMDRWGEYWRFTSLSVRKLFAGTFPEANVSVESYGNVLAAVAFLHGFVTEELRPVDLERGDRDYELIVCVRAVKPYTARPEVPPEDASTPAADEPVTDLVPTV